VSGPGSVTCIFRESIERGQIELTVTTQSQPAREIDVQSTYLHSWRIDFMDGFITQDVLWVGDGAWSYLDDFMIHCLEILNYLLDKAAMIDETPPFVFDSRRLLPGHPQHRQLRTLSKRFKTRRDVVAASMSLPPTFDGPAEFLWEDPALPPLVGRRYHPVLSAGKRLCVHIFAAPIDDYEAPGGLPMRTRCGLHDISELYTKRTSHFNGLEWHYLDVEPRPDIRADLEVGLRETLQTNLGPDHPSDLGAYILAFLPQYHPNAYRQTALPIVASAACGLAQDLALAFLTTEHACHEARQYDLLPYLVLVSPLPPDAPMHHMTIHTEHELD